MKTLLLTIVTALTFNANAGVPGSPIFDVPSPLVDACVDNVQQVASSSFGGAEVVNVQRTFGDLPANLVTYKVAFAPVVALPEGEPSILPAGVPTLPVPKGKPLGVPGFIIPLPQADSMVFIMEIENGNMDECSYFGSIAL